MLFRPGKKSSFYSIQFEGEKQSELEKFFYKFSSTHTDDITDINYRIEKMADRTGCQDIYFKPQSSKDNWVCRLRNTGCVKLYCIRYGNCAVILGGGEIKAKGGSTQKNPKLQKQVDMLSEIFHIMDGKIVIENNKLSGKLDYYIN